MSYKLVEEALITTLQGITGLEQSVSNKMTFLAEGHQRAAITQYNSFERKDFAYKGQASINWIIDVATFVRWIDEDQVVTDADEFRQNIIDRINQYHELGGTANVIDAVALRGRAVPQLVTLGSNKFFKEIIQVHALELLSFDQQDHGGAE